MNVEWQLRWSHKDSINGGLVGGVVLYGKIAGKLLIMDCYDLGLWLNWSIPPFAQGQ